MMKPVCLCLILAAPALAQGFGPFPEADYTKKWWKGYDAVQEKASAKPKGATTKDGTADEMAERLLGIPREIGPNLMMTSAREKAGKNALMVDYAFYYSTLAAVRWVRDYSLEPLSNLDQDFDRALVALTKRLGKPELAENSFFGGVMSSRIEKPDPAEFPKAKWSHLIRERRLRRVARWDTQQGFRVLQACTKAGAPAKTTLILIYGRKEKGGDGRTVALKLADQMWW